LKIVAVAVVAQAVWSMATRLCTDQIRISFATGSLVFWGGHVVLPLLQAEVVPKGWADNNTFLAGYGIAQALPGPLFSFAAYLGAAKSGSPTGWLAGLWCVFAILLPP
jgi:chromate transporter